MGKKRSTRRIKKQLDSDGTVRVTESNNNSEERVLSDFDRLILRAVNYKPKERGV